VSLILAIEISLKEMALTREVFFFQVCGIIEGMENWTTESGLRKGRVGR